jgi:hypothetical protein
VLTQPFLTELDSRAAIKGSRDPLSVQAIWTSLGRRVVGNLTTVSTSLRDFTTLILGYHFVERVAEKIGPENDLATFLKWEQLAAYTRAAVNDDPTFRGTERVHKNLSDGPKVRLSADAAGQILGNQKIYGLWGLYTVPARSSGLVAGDPARLTPVARALVDTVYLPMFREAGFRNAEAVVDKLSEKTASIDTLGRDKALLGVIGKILRRRVLSAERDVYRTHLLLGGPADRTARRQALLAQLLEGTLSDDGWELRPAAVRQLSKEAQGQEEGSALGESLDRIRTCEMTLGPAVALFDFILGRDRQTLPALAKELREQWGAGVSTIDPEAMAALEPELREATGDAETGSRWIALARALASGAYEDALRLLLEHNRHVMKQRAGAAPWVDLRDGRLQVRFRDEGTMPLPTRKELPTFWRHAYFIGSLRQMASELRL